MKRILFAGVSMAILSVSVQAADLASRRSQPLAPIASAPAFTWTGIYAGVNAGYAWSGSDRNNFAGNPAALTFVNAGTLPLGYSSKKSGFVGGGQLGYNYQMGQFVVGVETDIQYLGTKKTATLLLPNGTDGSFKQDSSYLGTLRGRLGFTPVDRLLVYGTAGLAYGNAGVSGGMTAPSLAGAPQWYGSKSQAKAGWTAGAGVEYALTNNITTKLEYLYYDLGKTTTALGAVNAAATATGAVPSVRSENKGQLARVGLNYKF